MADVLISLSDDEEEKLRTLAKELYGGKKGSLSEVVSLALSMVESAKKKEKKQSLQRLIKTMEQGYHLGYKGKKVYEQRDELYAERFKNLD